VLSFKYQEANITSNRNLRDEVKAQNNKAIINIRISLYLVVSFMFEAL